MNIRYNNSFTVGLHPWCCLPKIRTLRLNLLKLCKLTKHCCSLCSGYGVCKLVYYLGLLFIGFNVRIELLPPQYPSHGVDKVIQEGWLPPTKRASAAKIN